MTQGVVYRGPLPVTTPALVADDTIWIVQSADGGVAAFRNNDPRTNCPLRWIAPDQLSAFFGGTTYPDTYQGGIFRDPCGGSSYSSAGTYLGGPSGKDLTRLPVAMEDKSVVVHRG